MSLVKTSFLNGIAVIIKILAMLGLNKILALHVGPAGYAALGNFQNAIQMITTLGSGAITTGITKYTAEYNGDEIKQRELWGSAGGLTLICSFLASFVLFIFREKIASFLLKDVKYSIVVALFSVSLIFFAFNYLLLAILNGKKEIKSYVFSNILGSIVSLVFTATLTVRMGITGALISLATYQSFSFVGTLVICLRLKWFRFRYLFAFPKSDQVYLLGKFTLMALVSAVCAPLGQMVVRNFLLSSFGANYAGYWEALNRISGAYLMFITTTLSVYFLPRFSEIQNFKEIKNEVLQGGKIIVPALLLLNLLIYLSKNLIINLLLTKDFFPISNLIGLQVIGDFFRVLGWLLAYVLIAKAMTKVFIFAEIFFTILFITSSVLFSNYVGFQGVVIAYIFNYVCYLLFMFIYLKIKGIF